MPFIGIWMTRPIQLEGMPLLALQIQTMMTKTMMRQKMVTMDPKRSRGGYDNADDVDNSYTQDHCDRDEGSSDEESDDYSNDDSNEESEDDDSGEESDDYDDSDEDDSAEDDDDDSDEDDEIGFVYRVSSGGLLN
jgi:hypothetical protein